MGLTVSRSISGGLHEDLDIVNHGMKPVTFQLEIALRCDFADVFEVALRERASAHAKRCCDQHYSGFLQYRHDLQPQERSLLSAR